nr:ParB/RepB/Spo0J family partition protein [Kineosporia mesophila]
MGRGLGALIPPPPAARPAGDSPVDSAFFSERQDGESPADSAKVKTPAPVKEPAAKATPETTDTKVDLETKKPAEPEAPKGPELVQVPGAYFTELPVGTIGPNPRQPRTVFDEEAMDELVHSIKEIGVLQPIVVRAVPGTDADGKEISYQLIMGERRWRASQKAGLETVPAIVRDTNDDDLLRDALLENLHRSELNPLEEAAAYQQLLDDFGCTHEVLATRIGRSRPQISNTIRLLRLPSKVQKRVAAGVLSAGHARALLGLEDSEAMDKLATRIVEEGLSVRSTEEVVKLTDPSETKSKPRNKPKAGGKNVELDDLASRLADLLDTRVNIALGLTKGKLSVDFASVEDLNRILDILTPELRKAFQNGQ